MEPGASWKSHRGPLLGSKKRRIRRGFQSLNRSRKHVEVINRIAMDNDGSQVSSRQVNEIEALFVWNVFRNFCWIMSEIDFKSLKLAPALIL